MSKVISGKLNGVNSFADALNFHFSVRILASLSILITIRILMSEPIRCYTPAYFTDRHSDYVEQMCWMANSRHVVESGVPGVEIGPIRTVPVYHQWIPVMFALQALLFYIPNLLWKLGSSYLGSFNVRHIESAAARLGSNPENTAQTVQYMAKCLGQQLLESGKRWRLASVSGRIWLLVSANYTTLLHIGVKLLCIVNIIGQLVLLDAFLGGGGEKCYGFSALKRLLNPQEYDRWTTSEVLPTSFLCDLTVRSGGNQFRHALQCSLPMNLWYETVFVSLWFWFVFVAVATIGGLAVFVVSQMNVFCQTSYCSLRLIAMEKATESQRAQIGHFVNEFLTRDAWLILRQVGKSSGDETVTRLVCGLWDVYYHANHARGDAVAATAPGWKAELQE